MPLHASSMLSSLAFVALTFVSIGPCVTASCVFFRDGGFLHGDLWNASALLGWRTKEQQRLALLRQVQNLADLHLSLCSVTQKRYLRNS